MWIALIPVAAVTAVCVGAWSLAEFVSRRWAARKLRLHDEFVDALSRRD